MKFGAKIGPRRVRDYEYFAACGTSNVELPSKFALAIDEMAIVKDQGEISGCVSFAISTVAEAHHYKETGEHVVQSPGYIYGNKYCRGDYMGEGMYTDTATNGLRKSGFVRDTEFDIIEEMPEMAATLDEREDLYELGKGRVIKAVVSLNYAVREKRIQAMKEAIYKYRLPIVAVSDRYFGGSHCIVLYGWDDNYDMARAPKNTTKFMFRNSWGTGYKNGGNWYIPDNYIDEAYLLIFDDIALPFTDVHEDEWFYKCVKNSVMSGLIKGTSATTFEPNATMIRGDVAVIIDRLLEKVKSSVNSFILTERQKGRNLKPISSKYSSIAFNDVNSTDYFCSAVVAVNSLGIMNGTGNNMFEPHNSITRAEIATIAVRTLKLICSYFTEQLNISESTLLVNQNVVEEANDVPIDSWYAAYVSDAQSLALMQGDGDGKFRPEASISRAECTAVLYRMFSRVDEVLNKVREIL